LSDRRRIVLARTLLLASLIGAALLAGAAYVMVMACMAGGCGRSSMENRIFAWALISITLLTMASCVVNFLFRLFKHGWRDLGVWEKSVAYIGAAALVSPLLVDLVFELL
jgi:hypothetical protein